MADLNKLYHAILNGDQKTAIAVTEQALAEKMEPQQLINQAMIPAMNEAGAKFECEEYFVPELLLAARAMKGSLGLLRPLLAASGAEPVGRVVIGTVKGDLHDIGKNLVASMLEGGGFEVIDLGADVAVDRFVAAVKERKPHLICMSALLTVTMPAMKTTIQALREAGVRDGVKVMVGGAPVTAEYASEIGADGYADNASTAVRKARELVAA
jgi:corrinoid protein of di/trimethylamine methyltransferase